MDRYEKINLHCRGKVDTMENEKSRRRGKRMKKKVWIIGGGASGMMAAITAVKEGMDAWHQICHCRCLRQYIYLQS